MILLFGRRSSWPGREGRGRGGRAQRGGARDWGVLEPAQFNSEEDPRPRSLQAHATCRPHPTRPPPRERERRAAHRRPYELPASSPTNREMGGSDATQDEGSDTNTHTHTHTHTHTPPLTLFAIAGELVSAARLCDVERDLQLRRCCYL